MASVWTRAISTASSISSRRRVQRRCAATPGLGLDSTWRVRLRAHMVGRCGPKARAKGVGARSTCACRSRLVWAPTDATPWFRRFSFPCVRVSYGETAIILLDAFDTNTDARGGTCVIQPTLDGGGRTRDGNVGSV